MEAPDRIWIDPLIDLPKLNGHINNESVEYTRTDAFIEKAVKWLDEHIYDYECEPMGEYPRLAMLDDFVNYMKGE